jgi:hypothetical protein
LGTEKPDFAFSIEAITQHHAAANFGMLGIQSDFRGITEGCLIAL